MDKGYRWLQCSFWPVDGQNLTCQAFKCIMSAIRSWTKRDSTSERKRCSLWFFFPPFFSPRTRSRDQKHTGRDDLANLRVGLQIKGLRPVLLRRPWASPPCHRSFSNQTSATTGPAMSAMLDHRKRCGLFSHRGENAMKAQSVPLRTSFCKFLRMFIDSGSERHVVKCWPVMNVARDVFSWNLLRRFVHQTAALDVKIFALGDSFRSCFRRGLEGLWVGRWEEGPQGASQVPKGSKDVVGVERDN